MKKLIVFDVVGLTKSNLEKLSLPNISKIFEKGSISSIIPSFPAVTCSVQATITSGYQPSEHGIISNGYYDRNSKTVSFWEQPDSLVEKPRLWDVLKKSNPNLKTAVLFWQNSLYINSDIVITPKPIHHENKLEMWCYSKPVNYYEEVVEELGEFDLKWYWGPLASLKSSQWILNAAQYTIKKQSPDLLMVYLPHLDYSAQKYGPDSDEFRQSILELDKILGDFVEFLHSEGKNEYEIVILSEYGFNSVNQSLSPNLILRNEGLLSVRNIGGKDYLDYEHSKAFAMVDHQMAHVYIKPGYDEKIKKIFENQKGISQVMDKKLQQENHINHPKSGELILCSKNNYWFNYYWWDEISKAPPFAFTVDIHRKPGFDPLELFFDPSTKTISLDTSLIKGSHGVFQKEDTSNLPIFGMSDRSQQLPEIIDMTQLSPTILKFFTDQA